MPGNRNISSNFACRQLSPTMPIKAQPNRAVRVRFSNQACSPLHLSSPLSASPPPLHIVHKLVDGARCTCTSNPPFSRYHTDTQGSPSVGQWKTVAIAAHPEPCYHMIWGVMPLNQPPFLFSALLPRRCWCRVEIQNGIQSPAPQLCTTVLPSHLPPYRWYIDDVRMHGIIFYIQFNLQHLRVRLQTQLIRWI